MGDGPGHHCIYQTHKWHIGHWWFSLNLLLSFLLDNSYIQWFLDCLGIYHSGTSYSVINLLHRYNVQLDNQYIHFRLGELQTEIELVRSLLYQAADAMLKGQDVTMQASMLKLKCGRLAREVTDSCLQFWGGMGYTNDVYVSRLYRDLRLWSIGPSDPFGPFGPFGI